MRGSDSKKNNPIAADKKDSKENATENDNNMSAVAALENERAALKKVYRRGLFTSEMESGFLKRPQPFVSVFLLCLTVVVVLVVATTAVERIELPLEETLVKVKEQCLLVERQMNDGVKGSKSSGIQSQTEDGAEDDEEDRATLTMDALIERFGDISPAILAKAGVDSSNNNSQEQNDLVSNIVNFVEKQAAELSIAVLPLLEQAAISLQIEKNPIVARFLHGQSDTSSSNAPLPDAVTMGEIQSSTILARRIREATQQSSSSPSSSSSSAFLKAMTMRPTLPFPLPQHVNVLFNVLLVSDPYVAKAEEGLAISNQYLQLQLVNSSSNNSSDQKIEVVKNSSVEQQNVERLIDAAEIIVDKIEGTVEQVKERLTAAKNAKNSNTAAPTSSSASSFSSIQLHHQVEVATIRDTALEEALRSSGIAQRQRLNELLDQEDDTGAVLARYYYTSATEENDKKNDNANKNEDDDEEEESDLRSLRRLKRENLFPKSTAASSKSNRRTLTTTERKYAEKLLAKEDAFLERHYNNKKKKQKTTLKTTTEAKTTKKSSSNSNARLDPLLQAAARVAVAYELPHRYQYTMPPSSTSSTTTKRSQLGGGGGGNKGDDGHHAEKRVQVSFIVSFKTTAVAGAMNQSGASASSSSSIECTPATAANDHYVCLVLLDPSSSSMLSSNSSASLAAGEEETIFDEKDEKRIADAVGTLLADAIAIPNFRPDTVQKWRQKRSVQSCALSFAYLKFVIDLLADHPRAAFPEELRPLWQHFLEAFFFAPTTTAAASSASSSAFASSSNYDAAAAYLHQLLSHPSLIPEQTFPLEQMVVMYMPLLLPFIGAFMQCLITLSKYRKKEKRRTKEAKAADEAVLLAKKMKKEAAAAEKDTE